MSSVGTGQAFHWVGVDRFGQRMEGTELSSSASELSQQLRSQGVITTRVRRQHSTFFSKGPRIKAAHIAAFCRQLATLVSAGMPLLQSLELVAGQSENQSVKRLIDVLKQDVENGQPLSRAMAKHPRQFDALFLQLVAAGEQSGTLDLMLERLATHREKNLALINKTRRAMYYPATVLTVALAVTALMLVKVVPQFENLFASTGATLPWLTQLVIAASEWLQKYIVALLAVAIGLAAMTVLTRRLSAKVLLLTDTLLLRLPIVGPILQQSAIARFSRTFSTLVAAGVPVVETLATVAGSTGHSAYERAIRKLHSNLMEGQSFSAALETSPLFPAMPRQMLAVGEESGTIEVMAAKIAETYEREVDEAVESLGSLIEPLIILFIGLLIGTLVASMYLPIFKIAMTF